ERRGSARTRSEISDSQIPRLLFFFCPSGRVNKPLGEQADIESKFGGAHIDQFLVRRKQIKQQRGQSGLVQRACDELIAWAVPAAAAAVREQNQRGCSINNCQVAIESRATGLNVHFVHLYFLFLFLLLFLISNVVLRATARLRLKAQITL